VADVHPLGASIGEGNSDSEEVAAVYLGCQYWEKAAVAGKEWQLFIPVMLVLWRRQQ
jgi:hypothetical protein